MAFEGLSSKLQNVFKKLSGRGKLSEKEVKEAMREVKLALLEADVNFTVVKKFINSVTERAVGAEVLESLTPGQQVIKIVNDELVKLMGGSNAKLEFGSKNPSVILLAGLQGAGKTTLAGKLGYWLKDSGHTPLLVAADLQRPNAVTQLQVVGERAGVPVYAGMVVGETPKQEDISVNICKKKQLTNMRASGSDDALRLVPPKQMSLEQCLEFLADDELLEVTPHALRIRKTILNHEKRMKATHGGKK